MKKPMTYPLAAGFALCALYFTPLHAQGQMVQGNLSATGQGNTLNANAWNTDPAQSGITISSTISIGGSNSNQIWLWPPGSMLPAILDPVRGEITVTSQPSKKQPGAWTTSESNAILPSGNVGIGKTRPEFSLDVLGTFNVMDANGSYIRSSSDENTWLAFKSFRGDANLYVQGNRGHQWLLSGGQAHGWEGGFQIYDQTALESRFAIDTNGNVSIGANTIRWDGRSYNANTPPLFVSNSGSVGIGTTNPQAPLEITSTANSKYAIRFSPFAYNNYNVLTFIDGEGSGHGDVASNRADKVFKLENGPSGFGVYQWDNGAMAYAKDEHYRNISSQSFYIDTDGSVNIGGNGGVLNVKGQFHLGGTSSGPNKISNGGLVVTGSAVTSGTITTIVSTGTNQLVLIPQQGDLSMGNFTAGAQPK